MVTTLGDFANVNVKVKVSAFCNIVLILA